MAVSDTTIVVRSLFSRLFSTVVTAITVAVGVALVLVLLSMQSANADAFKRGTGNMHYLITRDAGELASVLNGIYFADVPNASIPFAEYEELRAAYPFAWAIPTVMGDSYRGLPVMGTTSDLFTQFVPAPNTAFEFASGEVFSDTFEIVVGAKTGLVMGDSISFTHGAPNSGSTEVHDEYAFRVVGVLETTATPFDRAIFCSLEAAWLVHAQDRRAVEGLSGIATPDDITDTDRQITGVYARLFTRGGGNAAPAALQAIFEQIRRGGRYTIALPADQIDNLLSIVGNINAVLVALAIAVLISSGITLMLALYNTMEQRRRQIAVLRVLGASRLRIFNLVLTESAALGLIGAAAGFVLSLILAQVVAAALFSATGVVVSPDIAPKSALLVISGAVLLAMVGGIIPAATAYRTSVVQNLKPQA
ncbi:MAG: ABC transporter permease [Planctomycetota bacterium]